MRGYPAVAATTRDGLVKVLVQPLRGSRSGCSIAAWGLPDIVPDPLPAPGNTEYPRISRCDCRRPRAFDAQLASPIPGENKQYDSQLDAYLTRYNPTGKVEEDLAGLLASSMRQLMRMNSVEVALFDIELCGIDRDIPPHFLELDQYGRLALSFKKSVGDRTLELLRRYKTTAERSYHRALQVLENMRLERKQGPPADVEQQLEPRISVQTRDSSQTVEIRPAEPIIPASAGLSKSEKIEFAGHPTSRLGLERNASPE